MVKEQALSGLRAALDKAVLEGDQEGARKAATQLAQLEISAAPKPLPYGDAEIRAELNKQEWFGTDPKRSAKAIQFGKDLDPNKFATAADFTAAIVKAVEDEFKPPKPARTDDEDGDDEEAEDEDGAKDEDEDDEETKDKSKSKRRRTDGPREGEGSNTRGVGRRAGPWTKLSDAPHPIQAEIKRSANKLLSSKATKEQRATFEAKALESHYAVHQRNKRK
jgi:hypothetical protein